LAWVETDSLSFTARHDEADSEEAARVLEQLERTRDRLAELFPRTIGEVAVVLHGSGWQLSLADPLLALARRATAPAGRRYLVGGFRTGELHVLAPRLLAERASNVPGSLEMLMLAPAALYTRLVVAANSDGLPPPFRPRTLARWLRWAWLAEGAAQYFSGQTEHARPAIARRLREGPPPEFPPGVRDAALLGGSLVDLLAREEGRPAAVALACGSHPEGAPAALERAFRGRSLAHTEATWRAHLARMAERG
jgi:hypothetical protein